jgi:pyruvate dehydrogenase E2 component (dihydrolipoamide acetyltransferase)
LAGKARDGKLSLEEMKHATITITNIGSVGGIFATPIINHPEVAILGMYKIVDRPIWENGTWKPAKMMNFTITCDHRLVDGAVAANFMKAFLARIENPSQLILDMM